MRLSNDGTVLLEVNTTDIINGSLTIPLSVIEIGDSALWRTRRQLTQIILSESVRRICRSAFWGCSRLRIIHHLNQVTDIEDSAFWGCSALTSIHLSQ